MHAGARRTPQVPEFLCYKENYEAPCRQFDAQAIARFSSGMQACFLKAVQMGLDISVSPVRHGQRLVLHASAARASGHADCNAIIMRRKRLRGAQRCAAAAHAHATRPCPHA
jgi:hypothetical protein